MFKRYKSAALTFKARNSVLKAVSDYAVNPVDSVTQQALTNIGCSNPYQVMLVLLSAAQLIMGMKWPVSFAAEQGLFSYAVFFCEDSIRQWARAGQRDQEIARTECLSDLKALQREPALASEACYLVAHRVWNSQDLKFDDTGADLRPLARYVLEIALAMGNLKAALDLAHMADATSEKIIPSVAMKEIRAAALERTDSRAMALYARHLLNQKGAVGDQSTRKLAFDLAESLSFMSEPADPATAVRLTTSGFHKWEAPWAILRDAAIQRLARDYPSKSDPVHKEINQVLISALRQGVDLYNDPHACRDLSDHPCIEEYSLEWVQLKTKSAMDGDSDSCYNLARYYLEYWGVYPCTGKMPTHNPEARIGLDWLELSAELYVEDARVMQERYLILALLMRENGMHKEGLEAVKRGIKNIQNFSTDHKMKTWSIRQLEPFDRSWEHPFSARVKTLLGSDAAPKLPPEKRYHASVWTRLTSGEF